MSELGNCPKCGSNNIELDGRPSAGMDWFYAQCECGFKTNGAFTEAKAIRELQIVRELTEAHHGNLLLKKVMLLPIMQKCLISLKQGQGVDLDEGKTLIQAFVATGMAKQEDFEAEEVCASVWQPIETAPRDGSRILLFYPLKGEGFETPTTIGRWEAQKFHYRPRPYWENEYLGGGVVDKRENPPTHWMPLPSPPKP